jgi:hypothetical protein
MNKKKRQKTRVLSSFHCSQECFKISMNRIKKGENQTHFPFFYTRNKDLHLASILTPQKEQF